MIRFVGEAGRIMILFVQTLGWTFRSPLQAREILKQMEEVGVRSFPVVVITAGFTGMVLALQSFTAFKRFGAETMVGTVVALSMTRELGPVLTGLMVSGRMGSAMAAELGTMRVTEQIDALYTLATNPIKYLIVPRFLATVIMLPILVIFADVIGILGGYLVSVQILGTNPTLYFRRSHLFRNDFIDDQLLSGFLCSGGSRGSGPGNDKGSSAIIADHPDLKLFYYSISVLKLVRDLGDRIRIH